MTIDSIILLLACLLGISTYMLARQPTRKTGELRPRPPKTDEVDHAARETDSRIGAAQRPISNDPDVRAALDKLRARDAKRRAARNRRE